MGGRGSRPYHPHLVIPVKMQQQAKVTSVDALENFRASLILFLSKAKPALEEVMHEVVRTRLWIEG